ncbi:MAG: WG repeat-containing protein, partial [Bacteroidota bacterium]
EEGFDFLHPTTTPHYFGIQELKNMVRESVLDGEEGSRMERIRMLKEGFDRASEDYFPFKKNFYWKLMRSDGSVLPGNFDTLSKVYEGYAAACQNGKWGLIDTAGNAEKYGGFIYDSVGNFADKIAWTLKDNEYRLIFAEDERAKHEASGPTLIQAYESYFNSHIDSGIFKVDSVKKTTKSINPFLGALSFLSIGNFTIIERKGKADFLSLFQERELYGLNYRDTTLIEPNFDLITHQDSVVYVVQKRSHKGMKIFGDAVSAKKKGAIRGDEADEPDEAVTPMGHSVKLVHQLDPDYEELGRFQRSFTNKGEESYVRIKLDGKWGYAFWNKGEQYPYRIIKPQYDLATDFFKRNGQEVALVYIEKYNLYFYINRAGQMLTRIERNKIW